MLDSTSEPAVLHPKQGNVHTLVPADNEPCGFLDVLMPSYRNTDEGTDINYYEVERVVGVLMICPGRNSEYRSLQSLANRCDCFDCQNHHPHTGHIRFRLLVSCRLATCDALSIDFIIITE